MEQSNHERNNGIIEYCQQRNPSNYAIYFLNLMSTENHAIYFLLSEIKIQLKSWQIYATPE